MIAGVNHGVIAHVTLTLVSVRRAKLEGLQGGNIMTLLKSAENQSAYLKAGLLGFAASGKTWTASEIAIGLAAISPNKRVAFFDTETGADYMIGKFKKAGIELMVAKTRAFKDLLEVVKETESGGGSVLIIDSITHVWTELIDSYLRKKNKDRLSVWDWAPLKGQWRDFTDAFLCSKLHIILCGRAAFTYEEWINDKGEKEIMKSGVKMRVETDFGFEPSLLMEMERIEPEKDLKKKRHGSQWIHRCTILKDRTDLMNGRAIDNPRFKDFLPIIQALNLGGEHFVIDPTRTSDELIQNPDYSYEDRRRAQQIFSEEIEGEIVSSFPGQSTAEKKMKADILQVVFDSRSWSKIKEFSPDVLRKGLSSIKQLCAIAKNSETPGADTVAWLRGELLRQDTAVTDSEDDVPSSFSSDKQKPLEN